MLCVFILFIVFYFCFVSLVELKKQISCSLQLSNKTDNYVAFKVIFSFFFFLFKLLLSFLYELVIFVWLLRKCGKIVEFASVTCIAHDFGTRENNKINSIMHKYN
jgi:hypothetical protein